MPYVCPNNCEGFQELPQLYIPPSCLMILENPEEELEKNLAGEEIPQPEMGVQCDEEGQMTNMWYDGTVGVPDSIHDDDCPPHCWHCHEEAMWMDDICPMPTTHPFKYSDSKEKSKCQSQLR